MLLADETHAKQALRGSHWMDCMSAYERQAGMGLLVWDTHLWAEQPALGQEVLADVAAQLCSDFHQMIAHQKMPTVCSVP